MTRARPCSFLTVAGSLVTSMMDPWQYCKQSSSTSTLATHSRDRGEQTGSYMRMETINTFHYYSVDCFFVCLYLCFLLWLSNPRPCLWCSSTCTVVLPAPHSKISYGRENIYTGRELSPWSFLTDSPLYAPPSDSESPCLPAVRTDQSPRCPWWRSVRTFLPPAAPTPRGLNVHE